MRTKDFLCTFAVPENFNKITIAKPEIVFIDALSVTK